MHETKVHVETSEYICLVKCIDGVVAQKTLKQELIRCKDCKYYKVYELLNHTLPLCDRIKTTMVGALEEDDYCSRAERKEE